MKQVLFFVSVFSLIILVGCNTESASSKISQEDVEKAKERTQNLEKGFPVFEFDKTVHDFGDVKKGSVKELKTVFNFTNTGESTLYINRAKGSCGCTVPEYSKEPLKPGETGKIDVTFNTSGRSGIQKKSITIYSNSEKGQERLEIKANLID